MIDWTKTYLMRKLCNFIGKHNGSYTSKANCRHRTKLHKIVSTIQLESQVERIFTDNSFLSGLSKKVIL